MIGDQEDLKNKYDGVTDDVLARAKAEYAGFGEHFPNDLAADLIALAESQAAQLRDIGIENLSLLTCRYQKNSQSSEPKESALQQKYGCKTYWKAKNCD